MSLCDAEPVNPREPGTMPRVWSDLIINCNESLAAGWRYSLSWAGPNASISDGYRLHLLQGQAEGTD